MVLDENYLTEQAEKILVSLPRCSRTHLKWFVAWVIEGLLTMGQYNKLTEDEAAACFFYVGLCPGFTASCGWSFAEFRGSKGEK